MTDRARSYRLGAGTRRSAGGRLLVGGVPPRCVRLGATGAAALDAALAGDSAPGTAALVARLLSYGMLDPVAGSTEEAITFVIPVRNGGRSLVDLVEALVPHGPVIVVDDGSRDGGPAEARAAGATVVPNDGAPGPGGARNAGWKLSRTEFVAFVDADCLVDGDWARAPAGLLAADPRLALVGPRVSGAPGPGRLAAWERIASPLDMGPGGGLVGPGRRVSYLPSAALVARRSALVELGGFDASLRFGEDVDLVWRAVAAGWSVRYAPEIEVHHRPRPTVRARARQHLYYGTSAAALEARHPGSTAPLRPNRMMAPALLLAGGRATAGLLAGAGIVAAAARRGGGDREVRLAVARLALEAELTAGRELFRALGRDWLPLTAAAAIRCPRARRLALTAIAVDLLVTISPAPETAPTGALLRLLDNASYSLGLWQGACRHRSPRALLPARRRSPPPRS